MMPCSLLLIVIIIAYDGPHNWRFHQVNYFEVILLSFIEGLTEFLPVSSTGHLILTSALLGIEEQGFVKAFNIIIQFGAILSVLVIYWRRFLPNIPFYKKLFIAFLPAAVIGLLVKSRIDALLDSVIVVGTSLFLGGIILIWSDRFFKEEGRKLKDIDQLSWQDCLKIGFIQCFAFVPGVSRSAATIIGGLSLGLSRKAAAEFSFFLAVPTLTGAALVKSLGVIKTIDSSQVQLLILGIFLSFLFAWASIRFMISIVSRYGFRHFGYYRIIVGLLIFAFYFRGNL
jgi:undecaprenyl-diphosphatase